MSKKIAPKVLKGFRDYLPQEMIPRQRMIRTITEVFERYGYLPLQTPCLEYSETMLGKYGGEAEMLMYRFRDHGDRDVCLRYDLTVPLARVVAQYPELPRPFRRYQVAPVWRAENTGRGRFREFFQCDADIVGTPSLLADAECLQLGADLLRALGVERFQIRLNNRKILAGLGERLGLTDEDRLRPVFRTLDKLETQGPKRVEQLLRDECALDKRATEAIFNFLALASGLASCAEESTFQGLRNFFAWSERREECSTGLAAVDELEKILNLAVQGGVKQEELAVDVSIARGLDYYTGLVFETTLTGLPQLGSVMSGGRYDTLIGTFSGKPEPAVGLSVGLDRLFAGLLELGRAGEAKTTAAVLVAVFEDAREAAVEVAGQLREAGIPTELAVGEGKLGKQLRYADRQGFRWVILAGAAERERGVVLIRDMESGEQREAKPDDLLREDNRKVTAGEEFEKNLEGLFLREK